MGKLSAGLLGGYSGKVGTTVGAIVKGQPTIRAYQKYVTNPKSARQVQVREQFVQAKDFVQANMPLCYRKQNMLGYGVTGNFQFAVGAIAKAIDYAKQNTDYQLQKLPWARKSISNGATFREDLFGTAHGEINPFMFSDIQDDWGTQAFFGTDVPIEGQVVMASLSVDGTPLFDSPEASTFDMKLEIDTPNVTGNPGVCGFHQDKADCGDWNYIVKVTGTALEAQAFATTAGAITNLAVGVVGKYPMESGNCAFLRDVTP